MYLSKGTIYPRMPNTASGIVLHKGRTYISILADAPIIVILASAVGSGIGSGNAASLLIINITAQGSGLGTGLVKIELKLAVRPFKCIITVAEKNSVFVSAQDKNNISVNVKDKNVVEIKILP